MVVIGASTNALSYYGKHLMANLVEWYLTSSFRFCGSGSFMRDQDKRSCRTVVPQPLGLGGFLRQRGGIGNTHCHPGR